MKTIIKSILSIFLVINIISCTTTEDLEKNKNNEISSAQDEELIESGDMTDEEFLVHEEMKEVDVKSAVVFLEPPETRYITSDVAREEVLKDSAALKKYLSDKTILPEYSEGKLKAWYYKEENVYQLHTQTYHSTIIQLEPGEEMTEVPYISEPDVWRISRGIGTKDNLPTQFIIIKPDYSGLKSTLIIITNRRVYQLELCSYKDHYMPYAKWVYPNTINDTSSWNKFEVQQKNVTEFSGQNVENLSFDYKIKRSIFKKPVWTPTLVYDDGAKTYIVLNKKALHMTIPTIFNGKKEIINKEYRKNIIVINELIEKVTLRHGKDKVVIVKKVSK